MRRLLLLFVLACLGLRSAYAQFDLEESHSTASLRGIDSLGAGVAWASGANGTVLRTEDGGYLWQPCTVPPGGAKLDFRGIRGFDANTAVVMSSGKGALSKIYRTTDGCQSWKLVFENPDADGFFDSLDKVTGRQMYLLGDPVKGTFAMFYSPDAGATWFATDDPGRKAAAGEGAFAASNTALTHVLGTLYFVTGSAATARVFSTSTSCTGVASGQACPLTWNPANVPMAAGSAGAGIFSLATQVSANMNGKMMVTLIAVGGDYTKPESSAGTAAWSKDGVTWTASAAPPGGYRSAVVFDAATQTWLAVGPTGTDLSSDGGKTWRPVSGEAATGWNAVSLPFVVGAKGRIGKIRDGVLKATVPPR